MVVCLQSINYLLGTFNHVVPRGFMSKLQNATKSRKARLMRKHINRASWRLAPLLLICCVAPCLAQELTAASEKPDGIYKTGEPIRWRIEWKGNEPITKVSYALKKGGLTEM